MATPVPRSLFVASTAWSLIVVGVLGILLALLTGMLWLMLSAVGTEEVLAEMPVFAILPPSLRWLMRHLGVLALFLLATSVVAIPLGIGLIQRREWARAASVWICAGWQHCTPSQCRGNGCRWRHGGRHWSLVFRVSSATALILVLANPDQQRADDLGFGHRSGLDGAEIGATECACRVRSAKNRLLIRDLRQYYGGLGRQ
ncbi:MAG: hypothetical protein IPF83_04665 [Rhodanobacteraceae bacterium]|nr:hypothetical protein [Rhodanobacteraceae bacterium]